MIENELAFDFFVNSITISHMQENKKFMIFEIGLFSITILFWAIWFVRAFAWVAYKDKQVKVLGTVLIALAVVMLIVVYVLFRLARPSYMLVKRKRKMVVVMVSALLVIIVNFIMLYRYRNYGYTISSVTQITDMESEGGNYYFQITDSEDGRAIRFTCDEETYQILETDEEIRYSIQYRQLTFGNRKAVLGYIDKVNTQE